MMEVHMGIEDLIARLGTNKAEGSSMAPGVPYQNIPGVPIMAHREHSEVRAATIAEMVPVSGKTILDLGCNVGTISGYLSLLGAEVTGLDHDEHSIAVAKEVHAKNGNANFDVATIDLDLIKSLPHFDIIVWLSQFNWLAKQRGLEYALECLWEIGKHCDTLVFETAGRGDGQASLDYSQEEILNLLCKNTIFRDIQDRGQWNDLWTPRNVFVCQRPLIKHEGFFAETYPGEIGTVLKVYKEWEYSKQTKDRYAMFLKILSPFGVVPQIKAETADTILMSWEGPQARFLPERDLTKILHVLKKADITHRDITPENLTFNGEGIMLLDFSFAVFPNEVTMVSKDLGGKYKCPHGFNDEYSLRKIQQELLR